MNAAVKVKILQKTCCLCAAAFVKSKSIEYCDLMLRLRASYAQEIITESLMKPSPKLEVKSIPDRL